MSDDNDAAVQKAIEKIEKLLRLAASNPNEAEAASATAKAMELLAAYNLDIAAVEERSGDSGKRLDEKVSGGMHNYQRSLMKHIARLNFCMYWTMRARVTPGSAQAKRGRRWTHEHRLVGRKINVIATQNMASYLGSTIDRLCRDKLRDDGLNAGNQFYSSWAVAFREGIADRVIEKIAERRYDAIEKEEAEARKAARRASAAGVSNATALTLASVVKREEEANYDFLNGEGAFARREAQRALSDKEWEENRARQAKAMAEAEKAHAAWAASHPEEAAAEEAARLKAERAEAKKEAANAARRTGRRYSFRTTKEELRRNSGGYHAGYEVGASVSIDPQAEAKKRGAISHAT